MYSAKIYIVWRSSKGGKDIAAIFAEKSDAAFNAAQWQKEAAELNYKVNYRVQETNIYGSSPIICTEWL